MLDHIPLLIYVPHETTLPTHHFLYCPIQTPVTYMTSMTNAPIVKRDIYKGVFVVGVTGKSVTGVVGVTGVLAFDDFFNQFYKHCHGCRA